MIEWKEKLQKEFSAKKPGYSDKRSSGQGNKSNYNNNYRNQSQSSVKTLPQEYLKNGYFDEEGYLKQELLTEMASKIAKQFGVKMNNSQLRKFYGHVKTAEQSYLYSGDKRKFINDIKTLDSFVAEAKGKVKVPEVFYDFIKTNVDTIDSVKDITKGLLPHFQAVVAYFTYHYPRSN